MKLIRDEVNSKQLALGEEFKITEKDLAEWAGKTDVSEDVSRKGDLAEYYAVTWLWDNGYEVFQNKIFKEVSYAMVSLNSINWIKCMFK